jgi:DNA-binding CsgD family transcriptional regulator
MEEVFPLILVIVSLIAGGIAILFTFQLTRKYSVSFVNSYFFYLVFLYIFGAYSLAGAGILERLLSSMEVEQEIIHSARLVHVLVGIPLIILSKYMLLRCINDFFSKKIHLAVSFLYFFLASVFLVLYGIETIRLTRFEHGDFQLMVRIQRWAFAGFMLIMYTTVFLLSMVFSRKSHQHDRSFARILGTGYLIYMILTTTLFLLSGMHGMMPAVFLTIFLSWHLIPVLFMNMYLEKFHDGRSSVQQGFEEQILAFTGKYDISKREQEVVHLICRGLSNQEISNALYISLQTVKDHVHRIFVKTGVRNRVQLTNLIRSG